MKIGKWGEMSRGEMSFGEKRRTCANFGKKWGEMIFGEKRRREKCRGENRHLGRNVFPPTLTYRNLDMWAILKIGCRKSKYIIS